MSAKDRAIIAAISAGYTATSGGAVLKPDGLPQKECVVLGYKLFGLPKGLGGGSGKTVVKSHRFVAAFHFGAAALDAECIRHVDGDTSNNAASNLSPGPAPKVRVIVCNNCGNEFKTYNKRAKYCSWKCVPMPAQDVLQAAAARARGLRPKSEPKQHLRRYGCATCGVECRTPERRKYCPEHSAIARKAKRGGKVPNNKCMHCGTVYHTYEKGRKYCSYGCHLKSGGARRAGDAAARATMKYGSKKDANHGEIVAAFQKLGAAVLDLSSMGCGVPDLLVCCGGVARFVDVKNQNTSYGKRGLNQRQREWAAAWKGGPVYLVSSVDDVVNMVKGNLSALKSSAKEQTVVIAKFSP